MGQIVFQATLGGQVAVAGPNTASSFTLTLPAATDTLVGKATTDTLTNKSISGSTNTLTNISNASLTNSNVTIGSTAISLGGTSTTLAGLTGITSSAITDSGLTSGRVTYAGASGLLSDSANLTFNGSKLDVTGDIVIPNYTNAYQIKDTGGTGRYIMYYSGSVSPSSGNDLFIGNTLNNAVAFFSNNTERMRIDSSGNVGIGTSSPSGLFTVYTSTATTLNVDIKNAKATGQGDTYLNLYKAPNGYSNGVTFYTGTTLKWSIGTGITAIDDLFKIYNATTGASAITIDASSNVGIGMTPANIFNVKPHANGYFRINQSTTTAIQMQGVNAAGTDYYPLLMGGSYTALETGGTERMRIDSSGNVLIGTTVASTSFLNNGLTVGSGSGSWGLNIYSGTTGNGDIAFADGTTGNTFYRGYIRYSHTDDSMQFATGATLRATIDSSGNLGLGVTPSATGGQLQVTGAINNATARFAGNANAMSVLNQSGLTVYTNLSGGFVDTTLVAGNTANTYMAFGIHNGTSYTERMRIDSSGNLLIGKTSATANGGDLQVSSGITFPATQVAKSDANTLDDYEEGTWTPTFGGTSTYGTQQGTYTKVGRAVYFTAYITVTLIGTGSTTQITGLPFAATTTSNWVNNARAQSSATSIVSIGMTIGSTTIYLVSRTAASTSDGSSAIAQNGSTIEVNGFYFV